MDSKTSITLRLLTVEDKEKFYQAINDNWEPHFEVVHYWKTIANQNYEKYVELAPGFSLGHNTPQGHVPCTLLFAFNSDGNIVGRTSIRHKLTDHLLREGGHIGYGVCPSYRRKGYATEILNQSLKWVQLNLPELDRVLVTCDEDNVGSIKTIEKNGGILENTIDIGRPVKKMRFWIDI